MRGETMLSGSDFLDGSGPDIGSEEGADDHLDRQIRERIMSFYCD